MVLKVATDIVDERSGVPFARSKQMERDLDQNTLQMSLPKAYLAKKETEEKHNKMTAGQSHSKKGVSKGLANRDSESEDDQPVMPFKK